MLNKSAAHIEDLLRDLKIKQNTLKKARVGLRRAVLVYENISDGVVITDANGIIQDINPAFSTITGYTAAEVVGHRMNKLSAGRHSKDFFRSFWERLSTTGQWNGDIWNKHKSGEEFISHLMINSCFNDDGTVDCRIGLFSNVTEQRRQEALIWRQAHFDHLTQLPNRLMFHENLQASIEQSKRSGLPFALVFLDLDLFKEVNDTFGHDEGDVLLQQVAQRISDCCRRSDQVARLGGDEFVVIIQDLKKQEDIHPICEKILTSVSKPYRLTVSDIRISCSVGVAFYPDDADNTTDLLKYVDFAMYAAKERGRNQYCLFSRTLRDSVQQRHDLLRDFQTGLDTQQFVLYYQPIIDLKSGEIAKAEALVRWQHPVRGLVSPADFIPLAEDSGLIIPLGDSIFQQAAEQAALWRHNDENCTEVSINVSPAQFQLDGLDPQKWIQTLQALNLPNSAITIEITERLLLESDEETYEKIRALRRAGFQIALDDFGTGYSSLSYLRRVDIDIIKIDQSFVRNLAESPENMVLCNAIIIMSHELGLTVVAEGIETPEQHDLLLAAGCDFGQGYLYSKPVSAEQFSEWLEEYRQPS
ncbi:MAG: EAL domain-containing protein [Alcaligenaceae bacterium]|nr:EAL domain-containing protein [Alcaligenaceae bacterium]